MTKKGKPKGKPKFHLESFQTTIDNKSMPLCFKFLNNSQNSFPSQDKVCDWKECRCVVNEEEIIRLPCFHMYHRECLMQALNNRCPHCTNPLMEKLNELTESFNSSLLEPTITSNSTDNPNNHQEQEDTPDEIPNISSHDPEYYESTEWKNHVETVLNTFSVPQPSTSPNSSTNSSGSPPAQVHQPAHPSRSSNLSINSSGSPPSQINHPAPGPSNSVLYVSTPNGKFWLFEKQISQSTLDGRNGSTACTFIAIILSKCYVVNRSALPILDQTMSLVWQMIMTSCIRKGNDIHDRVTGGYPIHFSVPEAVVHLSNHSFQGITVENSFDVEFINTNAAVPQSSLAFFLQRVVQEPNITAIVIISGMSICFVGQGNNIILMDSHLHGNYGALVGKSGLQELEEFLVNAKQYISPNLFNLCTVTFVKYT